MIWEESKRRCPHRITSRRTSVTSDCEFVAEVYSGCIHSIKHNISSRMDESRASHRRTRISLIKIRINAYSCSPCTPKTTDEFSIMWSSTKPHAWHLFVWYTRFWLVVHPVKLKPYWNPSRRVNCQGRYHIKDGVAFHDDVIKSKHFPCSFSNIYSITFWS